MQLPSCSLSALILVRILLNSGLWSSLAKLAKNLTRDKFHTDRQHNLGVHAGRDGLNKVAMGGERKAEHIYCDLQRLEDPVNFKVHRLVP